MAEDTATAGHVGPPIINLEAKLADVEEMGYRARENKGEVSCFKSARNRSL